MNDDQLLRYSRHILLDEVGIEGQQALLAASVVVIGAGGLGSPAAMYLASAGVGRITLVDNDAVDLTNLQRQILHTSARVGQPKAVSGREALLQINPGIDVIAVCERADDARLAQLVQGASVVFDPRSAASPCYSCLFPQDQPFEDVACSTMGVFAPLVGVIGAMQAAEALKLIIQTGTSLAGRLLLLDGRSMEWTSIGVARSPDCPVCSHPHHG